MNPLDPFRQFSTVVADTGSFGELVQFAPLLAAPVAGQAAEPTGRVLARFGREILKVVPDRVSTEVDARPWFDSDATVARGQRLVDRYRAAGIARERVLVKIAATSEGIGPPGCDLLIVSPEPLAQLQAPTQPLTRALDADAARRMDPEPVHLDEPGFRWALNEDAMATEKLAEGIRAFAADAARLTR